MSTQSIVGTSVLAAAALAIATPAVAHAETTSNGCNVSGPTEINIYRQDMNFSVRLDPPAGQEGRMSFEAITLVSPSQGWVDSVSFIFPEERSQVFTFSNAYGAHQNLTYGAMYEHMDGQTTCGTLNRRLTIKAASRPYVSVERRGSKVKVNGTIEYYNKDFTANYYNYGRWDRINRTYLDFQRYEGGRWVTKKSVLTDPRGNANTGWMTYPGSSSWRVQYRGGWALQSTTTKSVAR